MSLLINGFKRQSSWRLWLVRLSDCVDSEGQSAAIPVASMEFAAICLRNALLLLPEHQPQDMKTENNSRTTSQSGSTESGSENSDVCRFVYMTPKLQQAHMMINYILLFLITHRWFRSGKGQEADKFLSAAPSSPLRKQEIENLR